MNFALILALCVVVLTGVMANATYWDRELPRQARYVNAKVAKYQTFMLATSYYVSANPTYSGTITWTTLSGSSTTPDAMKNIVGDSSWKAVADGAGNFVLCANLGEGAVGAISQAMQFAAAPTKVTISGQDYLFYGDSASAATEAAKCQ